MRTARLVLLSAIVSILAMATLPGAAAAQIRVQETPALNGLGLFLLQDIEIRYEVGYGNTSRDISVQAPTRAQSGWYWGVFVYKPIVAHFLEMAYDLEFWQRDLVPRDTFWRDLLLEPIHLVAHYREGDFHVSGVSRDKEFFVGGQYSLNLGRIGRHIPIFQK
jgi:hypothetical protein